MLRELINLKKTSLEKEYFLIKSLIQQLDSKIKIENEEITKSIKNLETEIPLYVENINQLNNDIKKLRIDLQLSNPNDFIDFIDNNESKQTEEVSIELEENDLTIKKLYRLISQKCHPDKTDDASLHELFILASEAYDHNNYTMILEIYNKITDSNNTNNLKDISIEKKLEIIKKEYEKRKEDYNKLTTTNGYVINSLIKNKNINQARKIFLNLLFTQILELETLKKQLETNLNKKT